jgi:hypothetical protein
MEQRDTHLMQQICCPPSRLDSLRYAAASPRFRGLILSATARQARLAERERNGNGDGGS